MKILQLCDTYPPDGGGLGTHVRRLSTQLIARGHDVVVVAVGSERSVEKHDDLSVLRMPLSLARLPGAYEATSPPYHPPWPDRRFIRGVEEAVGADPPDVIHAHGWCVHSAISSRFPAASRVVTTLHDYGLNCPKKSLLRFDRVCKTGRGTACLRCDDQTTVKRAGLATAIAVATPLLTRRVRRFLAVSGYVASRAEEVGVPRTSLEVIPNFVDLDTLAEDAPEPREPFVLYAGPAASHKGRAVLLKAHARLNSAVGLRLAGGDGRASSTGVEDVGFKSGPELASLYRQSMMVVIPSIWADPCPTVALEAMANGRPVIASASGGLTEIVADGVTGLLVPPGDPIALSDAIAQLVADPVLREEMGARGRERVMKFSTSEVLPKLEAVYAQAKEAN